MACRKLRRLGHFFIPFQFQSCKKKKEQKKNLLNSFSELKSGFTDAFFPSDGLEFESAPAGADQLLLRPW